jgi:hypothetical protein
MARWWNWYTQQTQNLPPMGLAGSSPARATSIKIRNGNKMTKEKILIPPTTNILHSLRRTGYHWYEALMDIVDNSVDALQEKFEDTGFTEGVANIVPRTKDGVVQSLQIADNGIGMDELQLREILRLGQSYKRGRNLLGTFGMGLKTAGMALGKHITVLSTPSDISNLKAVSWNIVANEKDGEFAVEFDSQPAQELIDLFVLRVGSGSGTLVIIEQLADEVPGSMGAIVQTISSRCENTYRHMLDPNSPLGFHFPFNIKVVGKAGFIATDVDPLLLDSPDTKCLIGTDTSFEEFEYNNFKFKMRLAHHSSGKGRRAHSNLGRGIQSRMGFYFIRGGRVSYVGGYDLLKVTGTSTLSNVYGDIVFEDSGESDSEGLIRVDFGKKGVQIDEGLRQHIKKHILLPHMKTLHKEAQEALKNLKKTDRTKIMQQVAESKFPAEEFGRARKVPDKAAIAATVFSPSSRSARPSRKNQKYRGSSMKVGNQDFAIEFEEVVWKSSPQAFDVDMNSNSLVCKILLNIDHPWLAENIYLETAPANVAKSLQLIMALTLPWAHEEDEDYKVEMLVKSSRVLEITDVRLGELNLEEAALEDDATLEVEQV